MPLSASASPAPTRSATLFRHPVAAIIVVMLVAMVWATVGFASALFTNEIVVSDESYGLVRASTAGPATLAILALFGGALHLWRMRG